MSIKSFCKQFDRVYCLSLPKSMDRRHYIATYFSELGIDNYEFFDATDKTDAIVTQYFTDGLVATYPPCFRCGKLSCGDDNCNNVLIPPQVATFISYLRLWRRICDEKVGKVLVVEDDVRFADYAGETARALVTNKALDQIGFTAENPVLLRLGWALSSDHKASPSVSIQSGLSRMSNPCHAITQAMAALLLARFKKVDTTVDIYQHQVVGSSVKNYTVLPPLSYELSWSVGAVDSLIHPKPIRVSYLQKHHADLPNLINAAAQEVMTHFSHILYRPLLVIGHPRCGSGYLSKLLGALGLDVGHESMGKSGISSWMFAVVDISPYAMDKYALSRKFSHYQFTIHHVRNPRDAIPSIMRENQHSAESYAFRRKHILQRFGVNLDDASSELEKAILSYVYWNKIVESGKVDLVVRVEDEEESLKGFLVKNGLVASDVAWRNPPNKDVNRNKPYKGVVYEKSTLAEQDWKSVDERVLGLLNDQCKRYGYPEQT